MHGQQSIVFGNNPPVLSHDLVAVVLNSRHIYAPRDMGMHDRAIHIDAIEKGLDARGVHSSNTGPTADCFVGSVAALSYKLINYL